MSQSTHDARCFWPIVVAPGIIGGGAFALAVSAGKNVLASIRNAVSSYFDFISNTTDGVMAVDREHRIVFWNEAAEELFGFSAAEAMGRFCYDVISGRDASGHVVCQRSCQDVLLALRQEQIPTHEIRVRTKAGTEIWVSASTVLIPSQWQDLGILVHFYRNVSAQKELERSVRQLVASVEKLSKPPESETSNGPSVPPAWEDLTEREREVLRLVATGTSTKAIADKLGISHSTVKNHIQKILVKLKVRSRIEAVALAFRYGLIGMASKSI